MAETDGVHRQVLLIMGFMRDRKPIFGLRLILGICQGRLKALLKINNY